MFRGIANFGSMLRGLKDFSGKMNGLNEELKGKRAVGTAGAGLVEVEVNGLGQVLRVTIAPELIESRDREMLEDLLPAAINQAAAKAKELHADAMKKLTGDMNLPGLDEAMAKFAAGPQE